MEHEALAMVFAFHKFKHDLLDNKIVFYINHVALAYLMNKPQVSSCIVRKLLLFLEYEFKVVYKLVHIWAICTIWATRYYKINMCT
jgi:hypothetical protein